MQAHSYEINILKPYTYTKVNLAKSKGDTANLLKSKKKVCTYDKSKFILVQKKHT